MMKKIARLILLASTLALSACATSYTSNGLFGGYRDYAGPGKLEKVDFHGNGFISADQVQKFALYRCAEIAKQKNKPFFLIYDNLFSAARGMPSELPVVGSVGSKPNASAFVLVLDGPRAGAFETDKVLQDLQPLVKPNNSGAKP